LRPRWEKYSSTSAPNERGAGKPLKPKPEARKPKPALLLYTNPVKIALGQINPTVGDFSGNAARIIDYSRRAQGAGMRVLSFRHEQNAAFAAQGYARATGRIGVCCATSGPGATNLVTGLVDAMMDSIPVVALTGQVSTKLMGTDAFQEADTFGITRSATKHNFLVKNINDLPQILHAGRSSDEFESMIRRQFDTLYAEGQRGYLETLRAYALQFLEPLWRPHVDRIRGLRETGGTFAAEPVDPSAIPLRAPTVEADNRVFVVDRQGHIHWQYGQAGVTGSGDNQLNVPVFAIQLPSRNIMIVDQGNNRVIEVDRNSKQVVWSYGPKSGTGALNNPNSAELLTNGNILIGDENNNRVIEITRAGDIVWQYSQGLSGAAFASRLPNGDTLITDSAHSRVLEVTPQKKMVFAYFTNADPASNSAPLPTNAVQLANGEFVIADQFNNRVLIVNPPWAEMRRNRLIVDRCEPQFAREQQVVVADGHRIAGAADVPHGWRRACARSCSTSNRTGSMQQAHQHEEALSPALSPPRHSGPLSDREAVGCHSKPII